MRSKHIGKFTKLNGTFGQGSCNNIYGYITLLLLLLMLLMMIIMVEVMMMIIIIIIMMITSVMYRGKLPVMG